MSTASATVRPQAGDNAVALPTSVWRWTIVAGVATGLAYVLSPLTVLVALAFVPLCRWALRDLPPVERRWVRNLLVAAIAIRVIAIGGLFVTANRDAGPFAVFFGDELFFLLRSARLYNMWMGTPISVESFLYTGDEIGYSVYQDFLVLLQILFGPIPYGIHLLNMLMFFASIVVLYRLVRGAYGAAAAVAGLTFALFLPTLFLWSVSALKESLYLLVSSAVLVSAVALVRARGLPAKALALVIVLAGGWWLEAVRTGGRLIALGGVTLGYVAHAVARRGWTLGLAAVVAIVGILAVGHRGALPQSLQERIESSARYHRGYIFTAGHSYKLLDQRFYSTTLGWAPLETPRMSGAETARYLIRAAGHFIIEPLPWQIASTFEFAYMPEYVVWLLAVALLPIGLVVGWRRDALVTAILGGYSFVSAGVVAMNSGNIGTLVRHRALVAPYFGWISALGFVWMLAALSRRERVAL
jgi:hypothetical protein